MDAKFHPAIAAIEAGDIDRLRSLLREDPSLATGRSSRSHPTLLQCLVLDLKRGNANKLAMASVLIEAGAELSEPLVASGSCNDPEVAALLLDSGAPVNGTGGWSPLEEALYWNARDVVDLLLRRGAVIQNLRIAAGLGRTDVIEAFFDKDGTLKPEAGKINWPWGDRDVIAQRNTDPESRRKMAATFSSWGNDRLSILNNAFVYACMHGHLDAASLLLEKGAQINTIPGGFDYAGTGLHYAALNGHPSMVEFLIERGADSSLRDSKVGQTPAGWAEYGGHPAIKNYLDKKAAS